MVQAQICRNAAAVRRALKAHHQELKRERQEVRIAWKGGPRPALYTITGYTPKKPKGKYADTFGIHRDGSEYVYILCPRQLTHFEILPQRMIPPLALRQMKEMERAGGLDRK